MYLFIAIGVIFCFLFWCALYIGAQAENKLK